MQVRYLRTVAACMDDGEERLRARIALAFAAVCLFRRQLHAPPGAIEYELKRQILPDSGHISRNPCNFMNCWPIFCRSARPMPTARKAPPKALIEAVERMLPALRFFRHPDGGLALFNGDYCDHAGTHHLWFSGMTRLPDASGHTLFRLLNGSRWVRPSSPDTGLPPPVTTSRDAHAGCLAFEMSLGRQRYIVNSGIDRFRVAGISSSRRSAAAHSRPPSTTPHRRRFSLNAGLSNMIAALDRGDQPRRAAWPDRGNGTTGLCCQP